jgi:host factor-I protein
MFYTLYAFNSKGMTMSTVLALSENFFDQLVKNKTPVAVFLKNGIKLTGTLIAFDDDCLFLQNILLQMVYKHAITTVVPSMLTTPPNKMKSKHFA